MDYPPGGADPVHRHNASAFVYVLEGSIVMQMKGGEKVTLHPGDTFYEDALVWAAEASFDEVKSVHLELVDEAPPRHKVGRPVILTKRVFIKICHLIEAGVSTSRACQIEQVSYRIFRTRVAASSRLTKTCADHPLGLTRSLSDLLQILKKFEEIGACLTRSPPG